MRSINNVVDITNYVMLLTGQPLHAFDLDRMRAPALTVRRAPDGEPVKTLDGQTRTLTARWSSIGDAEGPTVIAGIMGGARGGLGGHHAGAARGRDLGRPDIHGRRGRSACAARPRRASRRGSSPSRPWRPGDRHPADGGALRGHGAAGDDRHRRRRAAAQDRRAARCPGDQPARSRGPARALRGDPHRARVPAGGRARRPRRRRAGLPPLRRHPRGRSH